MIRIDITFFVGKIYTHAFLFRRLVLQPVFGAEHIEVTIQKRKIRYESL